MHQMVAAPGFTVLHDPALACLHVLWQGPHSAAAIRTYCAQVLEQVARTRSIRILNDGLLDLNGWQAAVQWVRQQQLPQLAVHGVVAIAWVLPQDIRAQTHVRQAMAGVTHPLMDTFRDVESAHTWLRQVNASRRKS